MFLRSEKPDEIVVEFRAKNNGEDLQRIIGEFGNELINQRIRAGLSRETKTIRELIVAQAFAEADLDDK